MVYECLSGTTLKYFDVGSDTDEIMYVIQLSEP